jgi:hypothetical protein
VSSFGLFYFERVSVFSDKKSLAWEHFGKLFNNNTGSYVDEGFNYCKCCLQSLKISPNSSPSAIKAATLILRSVVFTKFNWLPFS